MIKNNKNNKIIKNKKIIQIIENNNMKKFNKIIN